MARGRLSFPCTAQFLTQWVGGRVAYFVATAVAVLRYLRRQIGRRGVVCSAEEGTCTNQQLHLSTVPYQR